MRILGIDPGINGACALYLSDSVVHTVPNGVFDLPVMGEDAKKELNYAALRDQIFALQPDIVVLERAMAMPSIPGADGQRRDMGAASTFKFGGSWYAIKAVVACLDLPLFPPVMPNTWKSHFKIPGGDAGKEPSRQMVIQRWPQLAPFLTRKMDHQRAEAFLIAVWYAETDGGRIKPAPKKRTPAARLDRVVEALNDAPDVTEDDDETIPE